jgi:hypothetical protein
MAELKTRKTSASVAAFIAGIKDERQRQDARALVAMMRDVTGKKPAMWGTSIVGFGAYHYKYASGREGDWPLTGFSPRKQNLTVYCMSGFAGQRDLLTKLGKHKTGVGCLYFKSLDDVDTTTLRRLISASVKETARRARG